MNSGNKRCHRKHRYGYEYRIQYGYKHWDTTYSKNKGYGYDIYICIVAIRCGSYHAAIVRQQR